MNPEDALPRAPSPRKQSVHEKGHDDPMAVDFCLDFPARPFSPCRFPHGARSRGCHPMPVAAEGDPPTLLELFTRSSWP